MTFTQRTTRCLAGSGLALLAAVSLGCSAENTAHPPTDDIGRLVGVRDRNRRRASRPGTVTNHSSKPSFYLVTVDFALDGHSFDSATTTADGVAPGETVRLEASISDPPAGDHDCFVSDIDRYKA